MPAPRAEGDWLPRLRLRVSADAERRVRAGHPWLFADSIREQNREGEPGELAVVYDRKDCFLAIGLFDPDSPLRMRVLQAGKPVTIDTAWWRERFRSAIARREGEFDSQTTGYRWIHGENDGWPGLALDRYDRSLVVKLYTGAWLPRLDQVLGLVRRELGPGRVVLRLSRNIQDLAWQKHRLAEGEMAGGNVARAGDETSRVLASASAAQFLESGLAFEADLLRGQKTGFFLDQRENRRRVESMAGGREVLNAFSFTGGFSIYAARGGARSVTDLDISEHALAGSKRNFELNKKLPAVAACRHETIRANAFEWLEGGSPRRFDLVVLDPPSLAKREAERATAVGAYRNLARAALRRLKPGGILVAASCSAHVSAEEFFDAVRRAAGQSQGRFTELNTTGHPPDHPATFPEANYLKCIFLRVDSSGAD